MFSYPISKKTENYFGGKELLKAEYATAESYSYTNRNKKGQEAVG